MSWQVAVFMLLLYLQGSLQPVPSIVLVTNWVAGTDVAPWIMESFAGGS